MRTIKLSEAEYEVLKDVLKDIETANGATTTWSNSHIWHFLNLQHKIHNASKERR